MRRADAEIAAFNAPFRPALGRSVRVSVMSWDRDRESVFPSPLPFAFVLVMGMGMRFSMSALSGLKYGGPMYDGSQSCARRASNEEVSR